MVNIHAFFLFASLIAAMVSIVSPDCDMAITRLGLGIMGSLYLNSDAISTSTGILANLSTTPFTT